MGSGIDLEFLGVIFERFFLIVEMGVTKMLEKIESSPEILKILKKPHLDLKNIHLNLKKCVW